MSGSFFMANFLNVGGLTSSDPNFDPVQSSIGSLGRWQIYVSLAIFLVKFPVAWHQLSIVFLAPPVNFSCVDNTTDRCSATCASHEFDTSLFTNTITMQWDLVCAGAQLANVAQTLFMFGILIGNLLFGYLSDRYGRRAPLVGAVILQVITGVGAAFVPNFWIFVILRFLCAMATGGTMVTSFVLVMELVGKEWRSTIGILYQIPFNLGHLSLSLIGYLIRDWRYIQLAISLPSLLLVSYYWLMPESPRWLMAVGKTEQAINVLEKAAKHNNLPTAEIRDHVNRATKSNASSTEKHTGNVLDLLRTPNLRMKTLCISFNWVVCGLCFFGVAQYLGQAGGNMFVNVAISAVVQIPGTLLCIYLAKTWGRRKTLIVANIGCGIACLLIPFVPETPVWPRVSLGIFGIFWMSISFPTVYLFSGELFPTVVRNVGVGTSSMCARVGSMVAPFVAGLKLVDDFLPPVIFGVFPIVGAILCLKLPETLGSPLPETIEDGENFGKASGKALVGVINDGVEITELENSKY